MWFALPTGAKGRCACAFLSTCPDMGKKGKGEWCDLKTVRSQTSKLKLDLLLQHHLGTIEGKGIWGILSVVVMLS